MAKQEPKKQKPKRLKLTISDKDKWKRILKEVEKSEAPVSVLQAITVNLVDGTSVDINIQELLTEGYSPEDLETRINDKLHELDDLINNVDFFISIEHVAKAVQPFTDELLKNLT